MNEFIYFFIISVAIAEEGPDTVVPLAEVVTCIGFLFVCFLEELIHHCIHPHQEESPQKPKKSKQRKKCLNHSEFELYDAKLRGRLLKLRKLARLRRPPAAFLLNQAITRGASGLTFCTQPCQSYMQSFIKIGVLVLEKSEHEIMTLCNFKRS